MIFCFLNEYERVGVTLLDSLIELVIGCKKVGRGGDGGIVGCDRVN